MYSLRQNPTSSNTPHPSNTYVAGVPTNLHPHIQQLTIATALAAAAVGASGWLYQDAESDRPIRSYSYSIEIRSLLHFIKQFLQGLQNERCAMPSRNRCDAARVAFVCCPDLFNSQSIWCCTRSQYPHLKRVASIHKLLYKILKNVFIPLKVSNPVTTQRPELNQVQSTH